MTQYGIESVDNVRDFPEFIGSHEMKLNDETKITLLRTNTKFKRTSFIADNLHRCDFLSC